MYVRVVPSPALTKIDCCHHYSEFIIIIIFVLAVLGLCCRVQAFSACDESGGYTLLRCVSSSFRGLLIVEGGFRGRGAGALSLCGMWAPLGPGIKPVSPALRGSLLTPGPPGKPHYSGLYSSASQICHRRWRARRPSSVPIGLCQLLSPLSLPQLLHL